MLRSILVAVDGSKYSDAAVETGLALAKRYDALLVGLGVVDEPDISAPQAVPLGAGAFKHQLTNTRLHEAHRQTTQALERFSLRCAAEQVASKPLEDIGEPAERLCREARRFDLIVIGQKTFFYGQESSRDVVSRVLQGMPRPTIVAPEQRRPDNGNRSVLIAYDGSLQASRALGAFLRMARKEDRLHVVSIQPDATQAAREADVAAEFLGYHDLQVERHAIASRSSPGATLLEQIDKLQVNLVVGGCYGRPTWKEFFLGSVTRELLEKSPVPLYLYQ